MRKDPVCKRNHLSSGQCTCPQKCQEETAAVEGYFADLTKIHYRSRIMVLEHRWNKCISLKGDYAEK